MESFIAVAGWSQHSVAPPITTPPSSTNRPYGHFRSLSSMATPSTPKTPRSPMKSPSTSDLPTMTDSPRLQPLPPSPAGVGAGDGGNDPELSTLPDPRSRTMSPALDESSTSPHHPDLNAEVASLSTKLVNALNYQTTLDDSLSDARSELDQARQKIKILEERNATQREMLSGDVWIRKRTVEHEKQSLLSRVAAEKKQREEVEQAKKKIEQELESLSTALFEEANRMVISAKEEAQRDYDALQRKNDQLKSQIADTEGLLKSQQEQLTQLKQVMEQMVDEREDHFVVTAPSSPGFNKNEGKSDETPVSQDGGRQSPNLEPVAPTHPTQLSHLIHPVLRTDMASYDDFTALARLSLSRRPASNRISTGSMGGVGKVIMGLGGSSSSAHPSNASTSSLPQSSGTPANTGSPQTPNTPASMISATSADAANPPPSLKETKFFKRVLTEDIEPTLRLDIAPGLSWLARRSVMSAIAEGTFVVEPLPTKTSFPAYVKPQTFTCTLCGDDRTDEAHLRNHRFRISESDTAQRYPLCKLCLGRVRSTCDFLSFLRILKDGHWRGEGDDPEKMAWEESVRLREQMFWARIGGGVVPAGHPVLAVENSPRPSPRPSCDGSRKSDTHGVGPTSDTAETPATPASATSGSDGTAKAGDVPVKSPADTTERPCTPQKQLQQADAGDTTEETQDKRGSTQSLDTTASNEDSSEDPKRLSITIPRTPEKAGDCGT